MKKACTLLCFICAFLFSNAQWSNTSNLFMDSLHMPVVTAPGDQQNSVVVKSYPDSGYFVIWEDARTSGNGWDIYAQKYDKNGKPLWQADGVAVVAGIDDQRIAYTGTVADYRYLSHACTDSADGFYIAWDDANQTNTHSTVRHRVCAQHMLANGSARFVYPGFIVAQPSSSSNYGIYNPQLIADGNKGFFVSYIQADDVSEHDLYVNCYRDENGTMVLYGGGQADLNAEDQVSNTQCGENTKNDVIHPDANVQFYHIYPDLQGGCNIIFSFERNTGANERIRIGFNRLCRVKKQSGVTVRRRTNDIANSEIQHYTYKKDSVVMLYRVKTFSTDESCTVLQSNGQTATIVYTNYYVENFGNGFLNLSSLAFGLEYPKGVMVHTDGNTNVNIVAVSQRDYNYTTNGVTDWYKRAFFRNQEIYDSLPFQLTTDTTNPYIAYKLFSNTPLDKINYGDDTIMPAGVYDYDFALTASNNRVFAAGIIQDQTSSLHPRYIDLQQLQVDRVAADSFAVHYRTSGKIGIDIGKEIATGFGDRNILYDNPVITADERGNALFSITDIGRSVHVSPLGDSGRLVWGAMGRPVGAGVYGGHYYNMKNPYAVMSPTGGTAVLSWTDDRAFNGLYNGLNIAMRHLDSLNIYNYLPPSRGAGMLSYGGTLSFPVVLNGLSLAWTDFEGYYSYATDETLSDIASIYDNYNLGNVRVTGLDNVLTYPVRTYNGTPYLDRNYTITPENNPDGAADIDVRLYFTTHQFAALQAADPSITSPGDLIIIKQPNTTGSVPATYTPVSGEERIVPDAWQAVSNGYYVQLKVSSFSNFFIQKNDGILPVNWLGVSAERSANSMATIKWSVVNETNVKNYTVQYSEDGITYKDGCTVGANNLGTYSCVLPVDNNNKYYFRVRETDLNGRYNVSKTVWLNKLLQSARFVVLPNPVQTDATLVYNLPDISKVSLRMMNSAGTIVWQQSATLSQSGTLALPMSSLPAGVYQLQIKTSQQTQTIKLVKQ